jgi:hypothetical protein
LKREEDLHSERCRKSLKNKEDLTKTLLSIMSDTGSECIRLPREFSDMGTFIRVTQSRSTRAITPDLVRNAITAGITVENIMKLADSTHMSITDAANVVILKNVRLFRTVTKPSIMFSNSVPRGSDTTTIHTASEKIVNAIQRYRLSIDAYKLAQDQKDMACKPLHEQRLQLINEVQQYMDRREINSQPILRGGGSEKAYIRRKIVKRKAPLLVTQFKVALETSLEWIRSKNSDDLTANKIFQKRDELIEHIINKMNELRLEEQHETITVDLCRKRKSDA